MKILHIIENLDISYGGPAKSVPLLVKYLNKLDTVNTIFSVQVFPQESNNLLEDSSMHVVKAPLVGLKKLKYALLKEAIINEITDKTIIHVHTLWTYPTYLGYKIAREYNLPLVVSLRGTMYTWALKQSKWIKTIAMYLFQKKMLEYADVIHITEPNEKSALDAINIKNETVLIPNGIELKQPFTHLDQNILEKLHYTPNKKYIMFLGRIVHNKGVHYLIKSFMKLQNRYPNHSLLIIGGIEDTTYFKNLAKTDRILFLNTLDGIEKHTIFSISELFVLPSYTENFGMAIAEAMSYELPIITTTGTPWKELKEKDAGWWVDLSQDNIDIALEEALSLSSQQLQEKGQRAKDIVKQYTINVQARRMKQCYDRILNNRGK